MKIPEVNAGQTLKAMPGTQQKLVQSQGSPPPTPFILNHLFPSFPHLYANFIIFAIFKNMLYNTIFTLFLLNSNCPK